MNLCFTIALRHLFARKRQSTVSLLGIIIGTGFFLAVSSLMVGSEKDFVRRLVDNSPHITIFDDFRNARSQPASDAFPLGAVEIPRVKPVREPRGIRGYQGVLDFLQAIPGVRASKMMNGTGIINFAGRDRGISLNGVVPEEIRAVSTIAQYLIEGSVDEFIADPDGVLLGVELAKKVAAEQGDILTITGPTGTVRNVKVVGLFRTGRRGYDEEQGFIHISRAQALLGRINRVNSIIVRLPRPDQALLIASQVEERFGYKAVSWQESSEDLMHALKIRSSIMYIVVSAVLLVAGFGIYNVISTIVLEKHRDIAILKSMGFPRHDILRIFLTEGLILGGLGSGFGIPFGMLLMWGLSQITLRPPGATSVTSMPVDWGATQFLIAGGFAMIAALVAAYLPARKGARVQPVEIVRGAM